MLTGLFMLSCNQNSESTTTDSTSVLGIELAEIKEDEAAKEIQNNFADTAVVVHPSNVNTALQAGSPAPDWDKKIIKTANIKLELKDFNSYNTSIHKNIKAYGAYIAAEEQVQNEDRIENVVTIKVPVLQFEELMNSFNSPGVKVINRRISTEDVTGEVVDTKARIDAKKQVRESYMSLLRQSKNMKEILQVQNEISSIQEELETAAGRVNYLSNQSSYSTIHLVYYQYVNGATGENTEHGFFTKLQQAFSNGGYIISSGVLLLVTIWPLLLFGFAIWLVLKRWKPAGVSSGKKV